MSAPKTGYLVVACLVGGLLLAAPSRAADADNAQPKPRIAFFPVTGDVKEQVRSRAWFALRAKLDRGGVYEVIDGPKMTDVAAEADEPITFATLPAPIRELGKLVEATVLVWGDMNNSPDGAKLRLKILDLREKEPSPRIIEKIVREPMDLRFAIEQILQTLPGVAAFEHPSEDPVTRDAESERLWAANRNLVSNGDFSDAGAWDGILAGEKYRVPTGDRPPETDKVVIQKLVENGQTNHVLAMKLSRGTAETYGLACLSDAIKIEENVRYRLQFRYKSDGPRLHVFVKGYTFEEDIKGQKVEREVYRRQVPPSGGTGGQWVTITDDLNPQHIVFPVRVLRVDLYAYLSPGTVMFDDVVLKAVGKQTRKAKDEAIDKPVSRPAWAK